MTRSPPITHSPSPGARRRRVGRGARDERAAGAPTLLLYERAWTERDEADEAAADFEAAEDAAARARREADAKADAEADAKADAEADEKAREPSPRTRPTARRRALAALPLRRTQPAAAPRPRSKKADGDDSDFEHISKADTDDPTAAAAPGEPKARAPPPPRARTFSASTRRTPTSTLSRSEARGAVESGLVPPSAAEGGEARDDAWSDEGDDDAKPAPASAAAPSTPAPSAPPMASAKRRVDRRPAIPTVRELLHQTPASRRCSLAARATEAGTERERATAKAPPDVRTKPCPRCTFANSFQATQCEMCEARLRRDMVDLCLETRRSGHANDRIIPHAAIGGACPALSSSEEPPPLPWAAARGRVGLGVSARRPARARRARGRPTRAASP